MEVPLSRTKGAAAILSAKALRIIAAGDYRPRCDYGMELWSRPFDEDHCNPSARSLADRADHLGAAESLCVARALQRLLVGIHRERHVNSDCELDIDAKHIGSVCGATKPGDR